MYFLLIKKHYLLPRALWQSHVQPYKLKHAVFGILLKRGMENWERGTVVTNILRFPFSVPPFYCTVHVLITSHSLALDIVSYESRYFSKGLHF